MIAYLETIAARRQVGPNQALLDLLAKGSFITDAEADGERILLRGKDNRTEEVVFDR